MSAKIILCRCEDVSLSDVQKAAALGYSNLEEVKRYTGFGTGPCQGKECLACVASVLMELGQDPATLPPFTSRPPLVPTSLKFFAAADEAEDQTDTKKKSNTDESHTGS